MTASPVGTATRQSGAGPYQPAVADLTITLLAEDLAQETGLSPHDRTTCPRHRRWLHQCVGSPLHAIAVTGHRWCSPCDTAVDVAVDELTGTIALRCPRCRQTPDDAANRQLARACRSSWRAARAARDPRPVVLTAPQLDRPAA